MAGLIKPLSIVTPPLLDPDEKPNDFDVSVDLLYQSFLTWHRLQHEGMVTVQRRDDIYFSSHWQDRYPLTFQILHRGSHCRDSVILGRGKYSKVYQRGTFAYKIVVVGQNRDSDHLSVLRCNVKELCFFHSMDHANIMKAGRSQIVMEHGGFKKIIHELVKARCTLQQMIVAHEITCFQDIVYLFRGIVRGLDYMHKYNIIHGDLKPSNILITQRYETQISDFTLTTFKDKGYGMAFGTLFWRSPECLLSQKCDKPSDIWSVGMMLLDCLYGCVYGKDILQSQDNHSLLAALRYILPAPTKEWMEAQVPTNYHTVWDSPLDEGKANKIAEAPIQITLSPYELGLVEDLLSHLLCWNDQDRFTTTDILKHPLFHTIAMTPVPSDIPLKWCYEQTDRTWYIAWRDKSERAFIQQWTKYYYYQCFQVALPPHEDWLMYDIIILVKRVLDRLKMLEMTFHVKKIIMYCCHIMFFIWKDFWPEEPLFESIMFHILYILRFQLFTLQVQETFPSAPIPEEKIAETQEVEKTQEFVEVKESNAPHALFTFLLPNDKRVYVDASSSS